MLSQKAIVSAALIVGCFTMPGVLARSPRYKLRVGQSRNMARRNAIDHLATLCEDEVAHILGDDSPRIPLVFEPDGEKRQLKGFEMVFPLKLQNGTWELTTEMLRALYFRRSIHENRRLTPEQIPMWLLAAGSYRVHRILAPEDADLYPISKRLLQAGKTPNINELMNKPFTPADPIFYELYADPAACLLRCIRKRRLSAIGDYLAMLRPGQSPAHALPKALRLEEKPQIWFEHRFKNVIESSNAARTPEAIAKELERAQFIEVVTEEDGEAVRKMMLVDEALTQIPKFKVSVEFRSALLQTVYSLRIGCPHLLRKPLDEFVEAAVLLNRDKTWRFRRKLHEARKNLLAAQDQSRAIQAYLIEHERREHAIARRVEQKLELPSSLIRPLDYEKRLKKYLDDFERKLDRPAANR